jgi:hypothetical protein
LPEVQNHLIAVVDEVVRNYDIDAIHFDDYFYPYKMGENFNDTASFKKYGGGMNLADWRRLNVNNFVKYCVFNQNYQTMGSIWYQPIWRLAQQISRSKRFRYKFRTNKL